MSIVFALTGPSSIGKTEIIYNLAEHFGGIVICGDKVQMLAGYPKITGAADSEKYRVGRYLYGCSKSRMERSVWLEHCRSIISMNDCPVFIDGLAWWYLSQARKICSNIIGIECSADSIRKAISSRLEREIESGLMKEIELAKDDFYFRTQSSILEILARAVEGIKTIEEAKKELIDDSVARAILKVQDLKKIGGIEWINHDYSNIDKTIEYLKIKIEKEC